MIKQTTLAIAVVLLLGYVGPSQQGAPCKTPDHIQAWTPWLDRDDPSGSGDWEPITDLLTDNPETMCSKPIDMEVMTISGLTIKQTKENIYVNDLTHGFGCRNTDQINRNCSDYKVRFSCSPKSCENVCWTKWYDRDNPTRTGDWENLGALHKENAKGSICAIPVYIEAVTVDDEIPAISTGQNFHSYSPTKGFVCRNKDQSDGICRNYKVRFGCNCPAKKTMANYKLL